MSLNLQQVASAYVVNCDTRGYRLRDGYNIVGVEIEAINDAS